MNYFRQFPKTFYSRDNYVNDFNFVTNLMVRIKLFDTVLKDATSFYTYTVQDGERPDTVAHKYYGDSKYAWVISLTNNYIDPLFEWPLNDEELNSYIISEYGSIEAAKAEIRYYFKKINGRNYIVDSSQSFDSTIDSYTFEQDENEKRREIKVLDRSFIPQLEAELKDIFK